MNAAHTDDLTQAFQDLAAAIGDALRPLFVELTEAVRVLADLLFGPVAEVAAYRYAIEHLDVPESDIRRVVVGSQAVTVVLWNHRRITLPDGWEVALSER